MTSIRIKRAYDAPADDDGMRILVDRLWPRGLRRDRARIDLWLKDVAPSTELRRWFGHDPARWAVFQERYRAELADGKALEALLEIVTQRPTVTLLFGAHDAQHNNARVLLPICEDRS